MILTQIIWQDCKKFVPHSKLFEKFRRTSNFTCIGLLRDYQTILIGDVMKKIKIKVVKNMMLQSSDILVESKAESNDNILFNKLWVFLSVTIIMMQYDVSVKVQNSFRQNSEMIDFNLLKLIFLVIRMTRRSETYLQNVLQKSK